MKQRARRNSAQKAKNKTTDNRADNAPMGLDPEMKAKLMAEAKAPWRTLRRGVYVALGASAGLGLATMAMRSAAGGEVPANDLLIQIGAVGTFGTLLALDRNRG
eukprot:g7426.t1